MAVHLVLSFSAANLHVKNFVLSNSLVLPGLQHSSNLSTHARPKVPDLHRDFLMAFVWFRLVSAISDAGVQYGDQIGKLAVLNQVGTAAHASELRSSISPPARCLPHNCPMF